MLPEITYCPYLPHYTVGFNKETVIVLEIKVRTIRGYTEYRKGFDVSNKEEKNKVEKILDKIKEYYLNPISKEVELKEVFEKYYF